MKKIPLFNSKLFALVDDNDFKRVSKYRWGLHSNGYVRAYKGRNCIYLHRFIMKAKSGQTIDHINRNKRDCQKKNLRFCTQSQNNANKPGPGGTSKYKGVNWDASRGKYLARIGLNGKGKNLGRFDNEVDAAKAYNEAALKYFGEFALLNDL